MGRRLNPDVGAKDESSTQNRRPPDYHYCLTRVRVLGRYSLQRIQEYVGRISRIAKLNKSSDSVDESIAN